MNRRIAPFIAAVIIFVIGLAFGAGKSAEDTSAANTASKILLAAGFLIFIAALAVEAIRRIRSRRSGTHRATDTQSRR